MRAGTAHHCPIAAALAVALLLSAPAARAEQVRPTPANGVATCLRATGAPGGLAVAGRRDGRTFPTDLLSVSPLAIQPITAATLGQLDACAATAEAGGGAVVAGAVRSGGRRRVVAAVRDPGGAFGAPAVLAQTDGEHVVAAMAPGGDAAVAWLESREPPQAPQAQVRLMLAARAPGGPFGPAREVFGWTRVDENFQTTALAAASDATGTLTIAWTRPRPAQGTIRALSDVETMSLLGGRPGPIQVLARARQDVGRIAIATAPGGAALLADASSSGADVFERAAAGTPFAADGPAPDPAGVHGVSARDVAVALRADGAAAVAWRADVFTNGARTSNEAVLVRTRAPGGPFGPSGVVDSQAGGNRGIVTFVFGGSGPPIEDRDGSGLHAAIGDDGRVVLTWLGGADLGGSHTARAATIAPDGTIAVRALGSACRRAASVAVVPGGVPAIAFGDNRTGLLGTVPVDGGALHVASPDEVSRPPARSPAPHARIRRAPAPRLRFGQSLAIPVVCDRPCDLLVTVRPLGARRTAAVEAGASAPANVARDVVLNPLGGTLVVPRAGGVPLRITACAPDGTSSSTTTAVQPARQVPPRKGPTPRDVRARRSGRAVVVTWTIARPQRRVSFTVSGLRRRPRPRDEPVAAFVHGRLRTRFRTVLRPQTGQRIDRVVVAGRTDEPPFDGGTATALVR